MKNFLFTLLLMASASLQASETDGKVGNPISQEGVEYLKELSGSSECVWQSMYDFVGQEVPDLNVVENYYSKIHKEMQIAFKQQISKTSVCLTERNLINVNTKDRASVFIDTDIKGNQIAIRLNDVIFINIDLFDKLKTDHKKYLIVHEMTHGLLGREEVDFRNLKVRSYVSNLKSMIEKSDMRESQFATLLENTIPNMNLFSDEKVCGVLNPEITTYDPEKFIQDCFQLYGRFALLDSVEPNVLFGHLVPGVIFI